MRKLRRIMLAFGLIVTSLGGAVVSETASPTVAAANPLQIGHPAIPCQVPPPAWPSIIDYCTGWVGGITNIYVYRVQAFHQYGFDAGGNWFPGTWTVVVDAFTPSGIFNSTVLNTIIGDWAAPHYYPTAGAPTDSQGWAGIAFNPTGLTNFDRYSTCVAPWYYANAVWSTAGSQSGPGDYQHWWRGSPFDSFSSIHCQAGGGNTHSATGYTSSGGYPGVPGASITSKSGVDHRVYGYENPYIHLW